MSYEMLTLAGTFTEILESRNVWVLVPLGAFLIPISAIIFEGIGKTLRGGQVEKSRREIAAYVAEGSMSPEEAERILNAGRAKVGKGKRSHSDA